MKCGLNSPEGKGLPGSSCGLTALCHSPNAMPNWSSWRSQCSPQGCLYLIFSLLLCIFIGSGDQAASFHSLEASSGLSFAARDEIFRNSGGKHLQISCGPACHSLEQWLIRRMKFPPQDQGWNRHCVQWERAPKGEM